MVQGDWLGIIMTGGVNTERDIEASMHSQQGGEAALHDLLPQSKGHYCHFSDLVIWLNIYADVQKDLRIRFFVTLDF